MSEITDLAKTIKEENIDDDDVEVDEKGKKATSRREIENQNHGQTLYASLHLLYYTGFYRVLPGFDFNDEIKVGFTIELFLSLLLSFSLPFELLNFLARTLDAFPLKLRVPRFHQKSRAPKIFGYSSFSFLFELVVENQLKLRAPCSLRAVYRPL